MADTPTPAGSGVRTTPRWRRRFRRLLFAAALFAALAAVAWAWWLPGLIEDRIAPRLAQAAGLDRAEFKVRRLGLTGFDLDEVRISGSDGRALTADSIRVDYLPHLPFRTPRLLTVSRLTVAGVKIRIAWRNGRFEIDGCDPARIMERFSGAGSENGAASGTPPVALDEALLRDCEVNISAFGREFIIPINAVITAPAPDWSKLRIELTTALRGQPVKLNLNYDRIDRILEFAGDLRISPGALSDLLPVNPGGRFQIKAEGTLNHAAGIRAEVRTAAVWTKTGAAGWPLILGTPLTFEQTVKLELPSGTGGATLNAGGVVRPFEFSFNQGAVRTAVEKDTSWNLALSRGESGWRVAEASLSSGPVRLESAGFTLTAPELTLTRPAGRFMVSAAGMTLENPAIALKATGLDARIPLLPTPAAPAELDVAAIDFSGRRLGALQSSFHLGSGSLRGGGSFINQLFPGARIDFRGAVTPRSGELPELSFEVNLPPWTPKEPLRLADWGGAAFGTASATGTLSAGGAVRFAGGELKSGVQIMLTDGRFDWPEQKLSAGGIRLDLRFSDLPGMSTPGGQTLQIGEIRRDRLNFRNIELRFNLASKELFNLEQAAAEWCGGTLRIHSLRFNPTAGLPAFKTDLYCENLELSEIVNQFNLGQADGSGALFGKIPVSHHPRRGFMVDASYLYSRPGTVNSIRIRNPEQLGGGVAGAALRQSQLDFTLEALRDFSYDWARLNLSTDGDDFLLSLQFDGRPNRPLPFVYDGDSGALRRDDSGSAVFEGIRLVINTRIPRDRLLRLSEQLQTRKENQP